MVQSDFRKSVLPPAKLKPFSRLIFSRHSLDQSGGLCFSPNSVFGALAVNSSVTFRTLELSWAVQVMWSGRMLIRFLHPGIFTSGYRASFQTRLDLGRVFRFPSKNAPFNTSRVADGRLSSYFQVEYVVGVGLF